MIKASDLKVGDKILSTTGIEYDVIGNHVGGVLTILANNGTGDHLYDRLHLFYDDIDYLDYAKDILNINLTTKLNVSMMYLSNECWRLLWKEICNERFRLRLW